MIVDRINAGFMSTQLDTWINANLIILAAEIIFRYILSKFVSNSNFDCIQKLDWCVQLWVHGFTIWGLYILNKMTDEQYHDELLKYHDPNLVHTCINVMIIIRSFSLFCCSLVVVCFYIFVMCAVINGTVPKLKYVSKIPGITKFINSKSREYKKDRDGEDAECSICL